MIWKEIRTDYEEDAVLFIDAWESECDDEQGKVIAKVFKEGEYAKVSYLDERAKFDTSAQEIIQEALQSMGLPIIDEASMLEDIPLVQGTGLIIGDIK